MDPSDPSIQRIITSYWDHRAAAYTAAQHRTEREELDRGLWVAVWRSALPAPPADVLDLGTGGGHAAILLAELGYSVTATDLSHGMLDQARARAAGLADPPRFALDDAVRPTQPHRSFDAVTSRYLAWTLREPEAALRRWHRLLRPGGTLALVDASWFPRGIDANPTEGFAEHYRPEVREHLPLAEAQGIEETAAVLERAGFRDVELTPLREVLEADRRWGTVPGHEPRLQHLITGRARRYGVRRAGAGDVEAMRAVERAAGESFRALGMEPVADDAPPAAEELARHIAAGLAWVVEEDTARGRAGAAGYLVAEWLEGSLHVEQVSVDPAHGGLGLGELLLERADREARALGCGELTLTTFAEVPWNAPYYERLGFERLDDARADPELLRIRRAEASHGLDRWPRTIMRRAADGR
ncbi:bifunctional class I SAM-dependent methyltransferase/GNAT family N-acetyltransferase [Rothia sp. AR01]|uniref:Bifunctional class I SAM-dependent methyltransferase/GNAT family N-acetyltransferase n=1 Tax=Rothia santali TaxID=2949643 RepID=A0A9X2HB74_9MICC|nr:GNAT family N-acetyltransferase [Rothia santali]MCP3424482.1 bifunctional class I SAM-dependent methyltransferase/GNAT family N-acetyltransferase [Rothia santali]